MSYGYGARARLQAEVISLKRWSPRQITVGPGWPSCLRPRKPPSLAIMRVASIEVGGSGGGVLV